MGVSLDYKTTSPVSPQVKATIEAEAGSLEPAYGWWAEPLCFFDSGADDGCLFGSTKIFLAGYSTNDGGFQEVDPDEDSLMAYRDTVYILEALAEWSRRHVIGWQIDCAGEDIGTISEGRWDRKLGKYMKAFQVSFPQPKSLEDEAGAISKKYSSRW
jgi:hypothetical protein